MSVIANHNPRTVRRALRRIETHGHFGSASMIRDAIQSGLVMVAGFVSSRTGHRVLRYRLTATGEAMLDKLEDKP